MAGADSSPIVTSSARVAEYRARTAGERADAIAQVGALLCAAQAELLDLLTAADAEGDWAIDGATGMVPWVVGALRVSRSTATSWVRAGAALDELPHLRAAFAEGRLSWDQVRPATCFVTPATDAVMSEELPACSAEQIEDLARQHKPRTRDQANQAQRRRHLTWRADHTLGGYRYSGFLPADQAARVNAVLDREAENLGPDPDTGLWAPIANRRADALVELADQHVAADADPDTSLVVVHVPAAVVAGHLDGNGQIDDLQVPVDSVLRLLCDTKVEFHIDAPDGTTVGIGRAGRTPPRWLRRRTRRRDGGRCRFGGCGRRIQHIHHIRHWTRDRGPTDASNLVGLCWFHHHLVHEGGWEIRGNADAELTFVSPYGREVRSRPQPLRGATAHRIANATGLPLGDTRPDPAA